MSARWGSWDDLLINRHCRRLPRSVTQPPCSWRVLLAFRLAHPRGRHTLDDRDVARGGDIAGQPEAVGGEELPVLRLDPLEAPGHDNTWSSRSACRTTIIWTSCCQGCGSLMFGFPFSNVHTGDDETLAQAQNCARPTIWLRASNTTSRADGASPGSDQPLLPSAVLTSRSAALRRGDREP
jgi:hypothetical protein